MKHKHYDAILAFAEGKPIQIRYHGVGPWDDWRLSDNCPPFNGDDEYRVKPEKISVAAALRAFDDLAFVAAQIGPWSTPYIDILRTFIDQQEQK